MGNCGSGDKVSAEQNDQINNQLEKEAREQQSVIKILLLGPGESGKSTILKQMRIIHLNGFTDAEIVSRRAAVYSNTVQSMAMILNGMNKLGMKLESADRENDSDLVLLEAELERENRPFSNELFSALRNLWHDIYVQKAYDRRNEFQLNDSAKYFLDSLERINAVSYVPTTQDILMTRVPTIGVSEITYVYKKVNFRIFDVGGQKSERRKWIHCFDNSRYAFPVALSEFDQSLREDGETNRMLDSMALFHDICNSIFFKDTSIILFLNKKDLFIEKIKRVSIAVTFPEYKGNKDFEGMSSFIERKFEKLNEDPHKNFYCHMTCATDTNQVQLVLDSVTDMIISQNFKNTGII